METPSPVLYKHQRMRDEDVPAAKRSKQDIAEENKVRVGQRTGAERRRGRLGMEERRGIEE